MVGRRATISLFTSSQRIRTLSIGRRVFIIATTCQITSFLLGQMKVTGCTAFANTALAPLYLLAIQVVVAFSTTMKCRPSVSPTINGSGCPIQGRCTDNSCGSRDSATRCRIRPWIGFLDGYFETRYRCACDSLCELYGDCCFGLQLQNCSSSLPSHIKAGA